MSPPTKQAAGDDDPTKARVYALGTAARGSALARELGSRFRLRSEERSQPRVRHLDTFDWRLFRRGERLTLEVGGDDSRIVWRSASGNTRAAFVSTVPEFAGDLPVAWSPDLEPLLQPRRLLTWVELELRRRSMVVLDSHEKIVARLFLEAGKIRSAHGNVRRQTVGPWLRVVPVRGYAEAAGAIREFLEGDKELNPAKNGDLGLALESIDQTPGEDPSRFRIELAAEERSDEALKRIVARLHEIMQANEDGTRRDLDIEFLHDFRVSVRRMRSALGQLDGVLPEPLTRPVREGLTWLGRSTGPTRDLDVYLEGFHIYGEQLGGDRGALAPLEDFLRREQVKAQREMVHQLDSESYDRLLKALDALVRAPASDAGVAALPVGELSALRVRRAFRRVLKLGRAIGEESPAEELHRLRIRCKKLRYLLEFFRSLYEPEQIRSFLRAMKQLQDHLGDFNDYEVQRRQLLDFAQHMAEEGQGSVDTFVLVGRLVEQMARRQRAEREGFARYFKEFSRSASCKSFDRLLSGKVSR